MTDELIVLSIFIIFYYILDAKYADFIFVYI